MSAPPIFRGSAVDRISDPEQLRRLLVVITRPAWAGLAAVWLVIGAAAIWSVVGRLPTTVAGSGIMLSAAGLTDIAALAAGVLDTLLVTAGDSVAPGTVVARVRQPMLEQQLAQAEQRVRALRAERDVRAALVQRGARVETERLDAVSRDLERRALVLRERVTFLERRVTAEREARALGLVTESSVQASVVALEAARAELVALDLDQQQNALRRVQVMDESTERVTEVEHRLQEAERELEAQRLALAQASTVISAHAGLVQEVRTQKGQVVSAGQPLLSLERADAPLQAVAFVARDAKRIAPGMRVRVSPAAVPLEEYGYIVGTVRAVSTQPATLAGMSKTLGNDVLVQQLAAAGASFLVEVELQRDSTTPSGFRWSSREGPPSAIGSGSGIGIEVEVLRRRPIELLVPFLRRLAGLAA